jgi:hypothetical protein
MMNAVRRDPEERAAFKSERSASGEEVFDPLVSFVSAMGKQAVIRHSDSEASRDTPEKRRKRERRPTEIEERGDGSYVEDHHEESCNFADRLPERLIPFE